MVICVCGYPDKKYKGGKDSNLHVITTKEVTQLKN